MQHINKVKSLLTISINLIILFLLLATNLFAFSSDEEDIWMKLEQDAHEQETQETTNSNKLNQDLDGLMNLLDSETYGKDNGDKLAEFIEELEDIPSPSMRANFVTINILEKSTGFIRKLELKLGKIFVYNELELIPHKCIPRNKKDFFLGDKLLLQVIGASNTGVKIKKFFGWLFSKDRSLSSYNDPKYEFFFLNCTVKY